MGITITIWSCLLNFYLPDPSLAVNMVLSAFCVPTFVYGPARSKSLKTKHGNIILRCMDRKTKLFCNLIDIYQIVFLVYRKIKSNSANVSAARTYGILIATSWVYSPCRAQITRRCYDVWLIQRRTLLIR